MPRLEILVDLDNTLNCLDAGFTQQWSAAYPGVAIDRSAHWDIHLCVPVAYVQRAQQLIAAPGFYSSLQPQPGGIATLQALQQMANVRICTHIDLYEQAHAPQDKLQWIEQHLGLEWRERTVFVHGANDKTTVSADYIIDDNPFVTVGLQQPLWQPIYYSQVYNVAQSLQCCMPHFSWSTHSQQLLDLAKGGADCGSRGTEKSSDSSSSSRL